MQPSVLLKHFQVYLPGWTTGMGGRGLMLHHMIGLLKCIENETFHEAATGLAQWRWQMYPWDRQAAGTLAALSRISDRCAVPEWANYPAEQPAPAFLQAMRAIGNGQAEHVAELWQTFGKQSHHLEWAGETCLFFIQRGDAERSRTVLESDVIPAQHPIRSHLEALWDFAFETPEKALAQIKILPDNFQWFRTLLEAHCLLKLHEETGKTLFRQLWNSLPWHPNLTLRLHDLLFPAATPLPADADTAILIYSWNNAELLDNTLQSLSQSELGHASLFVLDNGSTDHTPTIITNCSRLLGDRMKSMSLPINIGAPAARNWLLKHPDVRPFERIVFLDDDVVVPRSWLNALNGRHRNLSSDIILGCRIMDQAPGQSVQMADVNLLDLEEDGDFLIANTGASSLDIGLHSYTRPCLSVTGCCHMMHRQRAESLGGFDLRFNPSQFDDFDLDLRNALQGRHAFYAGDVAIRHCQRSSLKQAENEAKQGHIQGNLLKLNTKYTQKQKAELLRRNREILWNDLLAKTQDLENL